MADPARLGALDRALRRTRSPGVRPGLARHGDRGRSPAQEPRRHERPGHHRSRRLLRKDRPRAGPAPIIVGHSLGGLITQVLLGRGLGAAGVAIHPTPIKGVLRLPLSSLRSAFPVLSNPGNRSRTVALSARQFRYAFTNTLTPQESEAIYQRYHVPAPGRPLFQAAAANLQRHSATSVDVHNDTRAPLLLIAGGADHTVPATLVRQTYQRYRKSRAVTDYHEFARMPHFALGAPNGNASPTTPSTGRCGTSRDTPATTAATHGRRRHAGRPSLVPSHPEAGAMSEEELTGVTFHQPR
ncbi:alpha/beta hydrolase family protein [Nonomuraea rubra]|uniref:alpha/beta hydrolase family protein n=1 Tax=Nonomuraea rubra TaxID=46180 RepID=UPI00361DE5BE